MASRSQLRGFDGNKKHLVAFLRSLSHAFSSLSSYFSCIVLVHPDKFSEAPRPREHILPWHGTARRGLASPRNPLDWWRQWVGAQPHRSYRLPIL
jgi:hypothetical protein